MRMTLTFMCSTLSIAFISEHRDHHCLHRIGVMRISGASTWDSLSTMVREPMISRPPRPENVRPSGKMISLMIWFIVPAVEIFVHSVVSKQSGMEKTRFGVFLPPSMASNAIHPNWEPHRGFFGGYRCAMSGSTLETGDHLHLRPRLHQAL